MGILSKQSTKTYLAEFAVIVLGILMAFQVEEWRNNRAEQRDLTASIERLAEETEENLERCDMFGALLSDNALAVQHVYQSLVSGEIVNADEDTFVKGLTSFDVVPNIRMLTSVPNEMISTGLLKELDDSALRGAIARLPALDGESIDLLNYWRTSIIELTSRLNELVDYSYDGDIPAPGQTISVTESLESRMRVNYDFDDLAANRVIRNLFFQAVDVHTDLWNVFQARCDVVHEIRNSLSKEL